VSGSLLSWVFEVTGDESLRQDLQNGLLVFEWKAFQAAEIGN
jgi:hypothetical protein